MNEDKHLYIYKNKARLNDEHNIYKNKETAPKYSETISVFLLHLKKKPLNLCTFGGRCKKNSCIGSFIL